MPISNYTGSTVFLATGSKRCGGDYANASLKLPILRIDGNDALFIPAILDEW
jgi:hypothetical protein